MADIHGNADALRAVLMDVKAQGAERIIVNGDVVNRGPDSVQVLETLLARGGVSFTLGNHDDLLRLWHARSDALPAAWFEDSFWGATAWSVQELDRAGLLHVPEHCRARFNPRRLFDERCQHLTNAAESRPAEPVITALRHHVAALKRKPFSDHDEC